jgi:hypothetical protein
VNAETVLPFYEGDQVGEIECCTRIGRSARELLHLLNYSSRSEFSRDKESLAHR